MRKMLTSLFLAGYFFCSFGAPLHAQEKKGEAPAPARESPTIPYLLAGIGVLLVMVLVCMPARRE